MSGDLMYSNNVLKFKGAPKIIKCPPNPVYGVKKPFLMGFCGVAAEMISLMDFFLHPTEEQKVPRTKETKGLILTEDGIYYFDYPAQWMQVDEPFFSIGSGSPTALGAMYAGADTRDAIKAAAKVDPFTGLGYKTLKL